MFGQRVVKAAAIAAGIVAGTVVAAPSPADARAAAPRTCDRGDACVYASPYGDLLYDNPGNTGAISVRTPNGGWVRNNGTRYPGADHIQLRTVSGSGRWTICLHYGPYEVYGQPDPTAARLAPGEIVTGWTWRGECVGDQDTWHWVGPA